MTEPAAEAGDRPTDLRVEYEEAPENVDPTAAPRFSWRVATDRRGARQVAYRVVVGRERESVAAGTGGLWDSGRVDARTATGVEYDGPALGADETYWWSVKLWTDAGETAWADPAAFGTALAPEDWRGEWVAYQPGAGDTNGWRSRWRAPADEDAGGESNDDATPPWVQVDLGESHGVAAVDLHPADPVTVVRTPDDVAVTNSWDADVLAGFGFPDGYRVAVSDDPEFDETAVVVEGGTAAGDGTDGSAGPDADGAATRTHDDLTAEGRYVRVTATDPFVVEQSMRGGDRRTENVRSWACFALAGLAVRDVDGADIAAGQPVTASSSVETEAWGREHLTNGHGESRLASTSPQLRTAFSLDKRVRSARLHVAAVGYGEVYLNGERLGDGRLDPAWTDYETRVLYSTYDVSGALRAGENALGLWLGRGWFAKRSAHWLADGSPRARVTLTVEFADGSTRTVASDGDWRARASPLVANDIYDGETYDARREADGWAAPGSDDAEWDDAAVVDAPGGTLRPQRVESMGVVETFDVEAVHDHPEGPILDFGQNLTGWVELRVEGADPGDEVTLRHAEALTEEGALSTTDLRTADATDTYVARGDDAETYEPRFTYHGFRYAQVSGYPGELDLADVTAKAVTTAMERRGEFACSNADLNRVQHNAVWGLRGNTHSIPEDCPQRDERFGWTGDAHISTRALLFNFDAVRFEEKWARDHDDAASPMGYVPDVIPDKDTESPADPTWSITRVMLPWYCYRHDGDERVLRDRYEGMRRYLDYWLSVAEAGVLGAEYGKYGDWLAVENNGPEESRRGMPHDLFNTAFLYQVTDTFATIAGALGNDADAAAYRERAEAVADAFNEEFFDPEAGQYGPGTQSSYSVPLFLGLVPDAERERVAANLAATVESDGGKLQSGFLGTRPLIRTLADHGYADLAYEVVSQPEQPGWVYMAREGATTMWERWDSDESVGSGMNSLNHSPFTHVSEFFYEVLAGIRIGDRPVTEGVTVAPALVADLGWVEASVETRNGDLAVAWERHDEDACGGGGADGGGDAYDLSVTVPWNGTATVELPEAADAAASESGAALSPDGDAPDGVRSVERDGDALLVEVGAGSYEFAVE
ncbi:alpha-L-rhamnosidase [Halobacteriales archaeon QH_1_68_42]|nr:MAG: alpha-L-rhamnosidase [Halobacteriales archaeon QH_1_68_42]